MTKRVIKFLLGALGMVLLGLGALYALHFFSPEYRQEQAAIQKLKEIQDQYAKDTYGGNTPEETIQLFIDALKKGDIDLAAKYFVIDKQEEWRSSLGIAKEHGNLEKLANILSKAGFGKEVYRDHYLLSVVNENKEEIMSIELARNQYTKKWKIEKM